MKKTLLMVLFCLGLVARIGLAQGGPYIWYGYSGDVNDDANWGNLLEGGATGFGVPSDGNGLAIIDGTFCGQEGTIAPTGTLTTPFVIIFEQNCSDLQIVADIVLYSSSEYAGGSVSSVTGNVIAELPVDFPVEGNFMGITSSLGGQGHLLADGTVTGSALFTGSTTNAGTVTADALFVDSAVNSGTVGTYHPKPDGGGGGGINGTGILGMP